MEIQAYEKALNSYREYLIEKAVHLLKYCENYAKLEKERSLIKNTLQLFVL